MRDKWFWVWLLVLAVPVTSLITVQIDTHSGASIGGGSYDLGPFLYSWALIIVTAVWSLCAFTVAFLHRNPAASRRSFCLTAIGGVTFSVVLLLYRKNLS
ncbi:hypothetical protein C8J33_102345 [Rhizobium sp. PP-CC-3G-465]|nr:hypothetical protein C8J33_102345 [Rhizobium sp. PP-CC-3G-465]